MPDAYGRFKGISVPATAWERIFGGPACIACDGTGVIPDPDLGSGRGPYWHESCPCKTHWTAEFFGGATTTVQAPTLEDAELLLAEAFPMADVALIYQSEED